LKKQHEAYLAKTFRNVVAHTERHKINVFCSNDNLKITAEHRVYLERFIYGYMSKYRRYVAEIMARDTHDKLIMNYLKLLKSSIRSWNRTRISKEGLHPLFNCGTLDKESTDNTEISDEEIVDAGYHFYSLYFLY
jgi:hypothetical protein